MRAARRRPLTGETRRLSAWTDDVTASEVIDNPVDELIQTVLARGGPIVLAQDGALPEHGRVALTLR
jgi:hypothetical protein